VFAPIVENAPAAARTLIERYERVVTNPEATTFDKGRAEGYLQAVALLHGLEVADARKVMSLLATP
jgi:hypothetical protein